MKWKIKKKVSSMDMTLMLATKRRRETDGKATQFTYHGFKVSEEKLERAAKKTRTTSPVAQS